MKLNISSYAKPHRRRGAPLLCLGALAVTLASQVHVARNDPDAKVRACASVALAANVGTAALIFSFTPFVTQIGVQFWFLAGALHGIRSAGAYPR